MPQKREPGSGAFGHRLPVARTAAQRPENSSPSSPRAVRGLGLGLGELRLGVDVHPPAGEAGGQTSVHALLADRERELIVGDDDGRLLGLVVDQHLPHARRRQRLRDEAGRLGIPRDDVDFLAAELGDHHPDAGAARADARADRVDALGVRLHGDLRPVAGLAGDATDLDEAVCDLGHLELEQCPDELRIAPGQDDLGALRARADLRDDRLDAAPLLVALAVDLLGARQQRLHLAEVDEDVVAITGLLDDPGHDLADPIDVLLVHHRPLGLADPLEDHLLRGLRGDATEVLGRHVLPRHLLGWNLRPVEVEVVVRDERVRLLSGLDLGGLELVELPLARLLEQPRLEVVGNLDRVDAEIAPRRRARPARAGLRRVSSCRRRGARPRGRRRGSSTRCPSPSRSA